LAPEFLDSPPFNVLELHLWEEAALQAVQILPTLEVLKSPVPISRLSLIVLLASTCSPMFNSTETKSQPVSPPKKLTVKVAPKEPNTDTSPLRVTSLSARRSLSKRIPLRKRKPPAELPRIPWQLKQLMSAIS